MSFVCVLTGLIVPGLASAQRAGVMTTSYSSSCAPGDPDQTATVQAWLDGLANGTSTVPDFIINGQICENVNGLTISGNTAQASESGTNGDVGLVLYNVSGAVISGNTFPQAHGSTPTRIPVWLQSGVPDSQIENNDFTSAAQVAGDNQTSPSTATICGNWYYHPPIQQPAC